MGKINNFHKNLSFTDYLDEHRYKDSLMHPPSAQLIFLRVSKIIILS